VKALNDLLKVVHSPDWKTREAQYTEALLKILRGEVPDPELDEVDSDT
jgi:hypothetical protein